MRKAVICPRVGEEKMIVPGSQRLECGICNHPISVTPASIATSDAFICTPCAQEMDIVPVTLTEEQRAELAKLGYTNDQISEGFAVGLREYHAGRRS